jgi:hypothetical protein
LPTEKVFKRIKKKKVKETALVVNKNYVTGKRIETRKKRNGFFAVVELAAN